MENSKYSIKPKDANRVSRMSHEATFSKILESKADVNFKISKILTNALHWDIDFNGFKAAKPTVVYIPIKADMFLVQA
jgi:hypothetical protein